MSLKLMYITNRTDIAQIAENAGVDRIFVDLEYIGKNLRQGGMDTVQNRHSIDDIKKIKAVISKSELLVRCNPIHNATDEYGSTEDEIKKIIDVGADIIMLPYFKTADEVKRFIKAVNGKAKTILLFEHKDAVNNIDEILEINGIDEAYIGLNDLSLSYNLKFMFQLLQDGTVESICDKFKAKNISYGFGGVASIDKGLLPGKFVVKEHYRLKSSSVILSRSFCKIETESNIDDIIFKFNNGISDIRKLENECISNENNPVFFEQNRLETEKRIKNIIAELG